MAETADFRFLDGAAHHDMSALADSWWTVNNSSFGDYEHRADFYAYHRGGLGGIIRDAIGTDPSNVGLDVAGGSSGRALRDLLDEGILSSALLTNYEDERPDEVRADTRLAHIAGDIRFPQTLAEVLEWQQTYAPQGFALVMHRPIGALQQLPPEVYKGGVHFLLDRLRPGGLLFTQAPRILYDKYPQHLEEVCISLLRRLGRGAVMMSRRRIEAQSIDFRDQYFIVVNQTADRSAELDLAA